MSTGGGGPARPDALVAGARAGDPAAMAALFDALQPRLLRFLRAHERAAAEDIAAEVWLAVAGGFARFEGDDAAFRAWVFGIARRRLADHRRRSGRRPVVLDPEAGAAVPSPSAERLALQDLGAQEAVDLVVAHLTPEQAEVVLLRVLGDLDAGQVAEVLGRSGTWVRVTQHRALRRLADRIGTKIDVTR